MWPAESPASPSTPLDLPSPWDEAEGAAAAEDAYLDYLEGPK